MRQYVHFEELPVHAHFALHGNVYRKRSTRTAEIIKPLRFGGAWFYFRNRTLCTVGTHSRLAQGEY